MREKLKVRDRIVRTKGIARRPGRTANAQPWARSSTNSPLVHWTILAIVPQKRWHISERKRVGVELESEGDASMGDVRTEGRTDGRRVATKWPRFHSWKTSIASSPLRYGEFPRNNSTEVRALLYRESIGTEFTSYRNCDSLWGETDARENVQYLAYIFHLHLYILIISRSNASVRTILPL